MLSALFQVQHSIQLEAVNKIKVDSLWGFETHGFPDKASTTRQEWGRFREAAIYICTHMLICCLIGLHLGSSLSKVCPFKEWLFRILTRTLSSELDRTS